MAWSTTAPSLPSGVSWGGETSFQSSKFNNYQVFCTTWTARVSGDTYYIRLRVNYGPGTTGQDPPPVPQLYLAPGWEKSSSSVSFWYYTGSGTGSVSVGLSSENGYFNTGAASKAISIPAKWTFAITYYGNGNTGGSTTGQTHTSGMATTISANGFTRTGYAFTGWNTKADGTGISYSVGASYNTDAALNLYAQWIKTNIPVYVNVSGVVKQVDKAYANIGGTVKEVTVYTNVGGVIKELI